MSSESQLFQTIADDIFVHGYSINPNVLPQELTLELSHIAVALKGDQFEFA